VKSSLVVRNLVQTKQEPNPSSSMPAKGTVNSAPPDQTHRRPSSAENKLVSGTSGAGSGRRIDSDESGCRFSMMKVPLIPFATL